jgi:hypothetical protein
LQSKNQQGKIIDHDYLSREEVRRSNTFLERERERERERAKSTKIFGEKAGHVMTFDIYISHYQVHQNPPKSMT